MEVSSPEDETRALKELLHMFGAAFELREIAAAFCKAGSSFEAAAEILSESNGCSSAPSTVYSNANSPVGVLSKQLLKNVSKSSADADSKPSKPRKNSVSTGTISSVLGKGYSKPTKLSNGSLQTSKPIKVNLSDFEVNGIDGNDVKSESLTRTDAINNNVEEFLFKLLGDGFLLGMDVIRDVLGSCGYDANKSIDKLIDLSASTLNRSDDIVGGAVEKSAGDDSTDDTVHSKRNGASVSREVLTTLFCVPERQVEQPRKPFLVRAVKKTRTYGTVVSEPLLDRTPTLVTDSADLQQYTENDLEEEDGYQVLRRNAKEHWVTMKEYYKDALDEFSKGNLTRAEVFLQQGHFFNQKAREADEKSSQNILEYSIKENHDDVILDLHDHDAKEAIRLLKVHLTNFLGIQNLKVILEADSEDITKVSRRRRQVMKLLEQESIKWTEEGGTITIQLAEMKQGEFSFVKRAK